MPDAAVRHPLFARLYMWMTRHECAAVTEHRRQLLAGLTGRVIELGAGNGGNFKHYPAGVVEVLAVEPEPYLRERALAVAAAAPVRVTVVEGTAEHLPAADGSFDAAVACLVLCSVPSQATALAELRRVLRKNGELRFYEHVLSRTPMLAATQRLVDRTFWPATFGGCHTARDTTAAIQVAGFEIETQRRMWIAPVPVAVPSATHVLGRARLPSSVKHWSSCGSDARNR